MLQEEVEYVSGHLKGDHFRVEAAFGVEGQAAFHPLPQLSEERVHVVGFERAHAKAVHRDVELNPAP